MTSLISDTQLIDIFEKGIHKNVLCIPDPFDVNKAYPMARLILAVRRDQLKYMLDSLRVVIQANQVLLQGGEMSDFSKGIQMSIDSLSRQLTDLEKVMILPLDMPSRMQ